MTSAGAQGPALATPIVSSFWRDAAGVAALALFGILVRYLAWRFSTGGTGIAEYVQAFCVWDCAWYRTIVETGYDLAPGMRLVPGGANWAFFPLYPAIVALIRWPTGIDAQAVGFVLSTLFIITAALLSRQLIANRRAWWLFAFMLTAGPFAFLSSILYTESLFILLTITVLVMLERRNYLAAGLAAGFLSATRVTGVLMVFAIVTQAFIDHRRDGGRITDFPRRVFGDPGLLLGIFLAPLGVAIYAAYLYVRTGDALAFAHIQRAWNRELVNPLYALWEGLSQSLTPTSDAQIISVWSWGATAGVALTAVLFARGKIAAGLFCLLCIIVSLSAGVGSMLRFVAGLAPLGMVLAELLAMSRILTWISVVVMTGTGIALTIGWFRASLVVM
jgi:hypothetical protein